MRNVSSYLEGQGLSHKLIKVPLVILDGPALELGFQCPEVPPRVIVAKGILVLLVLRLAGTPVELGRADELAQADTDEFVLLTVHLYALKDITILSLEFFFESILLLLTNFILLLALHSASSGNPPQKALFIAFLRGNKN